MLINKLPLTCLPPTLQTHIFTAFSNIYLGQETRLCNDVTMQNLCVFKPVQDGRKGKLNCEFLLIVIRLASQNSTLWNKHCVYSSAVFWQMFFKDHLLNRQKCDKSVYRHRSLEFISRKRLRKWQNWLRKSMKLNQKLNLLQDIKNYNWQYSLTISLHTE